MPFTLDSPPLHYLLAAFLFQAGPILALLLFVLRFLWQPRSTYDARDVLHAAPAHPVSQPHPLLDFASRAVPAAALLLPLIAGMALLYAFLFLDPVALMGYQVEQGASAGPGINLLPRDAVLVSLAVVAGLVLRRQLRGPQRDVLGVSAHA